MCSGSTTPVFSQPCADRRRGSTSRTAQQAREAGPQTPALYDIDFLFGMYDENQMGALGFKLDPACPFLDNNKTSPTQSWSLSGSCSMPHLGRIGSAGKIGKLRTWRQKTKTAFR